MRQFVGVILIRDDGAALAQHRDNKPNILGPDTWAVLGGALEEGEELKQAGVREIEEETGYKINPAELELLTEDEYVSEKGIPIHRTIYYARYDGVQTIETREGQEITFITRDRMRDLKFYTGHEAFFRKGMDLNLSRNPEKL